jgi:hypothetical protein
VPLWLPELDRAASFPRALVDEVIEATGRREQRNRLLPAHLTVYYVLAMTLFSSAGYEEVMRSLTEGLAWASDGHERYELPSQVAISKARPRLGPKPLAELFARACVPLGTPATRGAFYRQWRLVSIDGTTIDVADTPANAGVFGRAGTGRGDGSAFPQVRIVALGECGTHAVIAAAMDSYAVGEVTLAKAMITALDPGMLCLADRGFTAHPLFAAAAATGAALLWRAKTNAVFPVLERLPDGSFLSELVAATDKRNREQVLPVRVVEYAIDDDGRPGAKNTTYRLLTNLLDLARAPADELAALYAGRSSRSSTSSRPTSAVHGSSCAHAPPKASTKRPGATCACTTPCARSSMTTPPPTTATWTPTGSASPRRCTRPGAASGPAWPAP